MNTNMAFLSAHPLQLSNTSRVAKIAPSNPSRTTAIRAVIDIPPSPKVSRSKRAAWKPDSWKDRKALQQPNYPDRAEVEKVERKIASSPPLVGAEELRTLRAELADASVGKAFVLQGGDCAEDLNESADGVASTLRALFRMAVILMWGSRVPVIKIGRLGGQYAKPRSEDLETINGESLPSYRGEIINGSPFTAEARIPDPDRMLKAYMRSAETTNYMRSLTSGGFASLQHVQEWGMDWCNITEKGQEYCKTAERISEAVDFMNTCGLQKNAVMESTKVYTSHEGLLLPYEQALVRIDQDTGEYYSGSGHFIWIGERTRGVNDAHIEFIRGIANPVAVKVGSTMTRDELLTICELLNPDNIAGKLSLITRMGSGKIESNLPKLVRAVKEEGYHVVWISDSMHGNTYKSASGYKTRNFDEIMKEVRGFFNVHRAEGTVPGGLHFEMTGKKVTECVGGLGGLEDTDLNRAYESLCDPRLNIDQSLQMAFEVADILAAERLSA